MNIIKIPKKTKGEFREICVPSYKEKAKMREFLPALNAKAVQLCDKHVVQGFMHGKSPVTNALLHVGYQYTLKFDLSNFFDTVTPKHLAGKLTKAECDILMPNGRAYQGLPTSPVIANLAAKDMDAAILKKIGDRDIMFTRYADDMCFSFNDFENVAFLKTSISQIVGRCGFLLNKQKTWLQDARYGKRHVTGVSVDSEGITASRKVRRRLRAAQHQKNYHQARGLEEWVKLKTPNPPDENKLRQKNVDLLCRQWRVPKLSLHQIPDKGPDIMMADDVLLSADSIQMLGLSNFTTGWTSCMAHPGGQYHRKAPFWCYLKGTRIVGLLSGKTQTVCGITRPLFAARALVHEMEDGTLYYDRIYYDQSAKSHDRIIEVLQSSGILPISNAKRGTYVVGEVRMQGTNRRLVPYFDSLYATKSPDGLSYRVRR